MASSERERRPASATLVMLLVEALNDCNLPRWRWARTGRLRGKSRTEGDEAARELRARTAVARDPKSSSSGALPWPRCAEGSSISALSSTMKAFTEDTRSGMLAAERANEIQKVAAKRAREIQDAHASSSPSSRARL